MSVTFQANIDYSKVEKVKVYMTDKYQGLSEEDFVHDVFVQKDTENNRYFEMEHKIDFFYEVNMSNVNFSLVLKVIDNNMAIMSEIDGGVGSIAYEDLPSFQKKVMLALNKSDNKLAGFERDSYSNGNFHHMGASKDYIKERLENILEVVKNAMERGLGVFWS